MRLTNPDLQSSMGGYRCYSTRTSIPMPRIVSNCSEFSGKVMEFVGYRERVEPMLGKRR